MNYPKGYWLTKQLVSTPITFKHKETKNMKYKEFIKAVKEEVAGRTGRNVAVHPVLKNNDTLYQGLIIMDPVLNVSPTIYLDPYFQQYADGQQLDVIIGDESL